MEKNERKISVYLNFEHLRRLKLLKIKRPKISWEKNHWHKLPAS